MGLVKRIQTPRRITTIKPSATNGIFVLEKPLPKKRIDMDEFLEMEHDMKHFVLSNDKYSITKNKNINFIIDNEQKLGFYNKGVTLICNKQGRWYKSSNLLAYIVYNKETRKVKVSKTFPSQFNNFFLNHYFRYSTLINHLNIKLSATLCKRIIEGKANTIEDFVKYARSYVVKNTKIPLDVLCKYLMSGTSYLIPILEDPENLEDVSQITGIPVPSYLINYKPFKLKLNDLGNAEKRVDEYIKKTNTKFTDLKGQGECRIGNSDLEQFIC